MALIIENLTHHAYCLIGGSVLLQELIAELEKVHNIEAQGNPDFYHRYFANFVIDDARDLIAFHEMRPVHASGKKIIIVQADNIHMEAQNALLKLLEEPAEYAHFFIIIPSRHLLIPTIQSRLSFVNSPKSHSTNREDHTPILKGVNKSNQNGKGSKNDSYDDKIKTGVFSATFLKSPISKRLEMVKKVVDDIADEKMSKRYAVEFVNAIEQIIIKEKGVKLGATSLAAIAFARTYMNDRAPSLKMLLEYVALNV